MANSKKYLCFQRFISKQEMLVSADYIIEASNDFEAQTKSFSMFNAFRANHNQENPDDFIRPYSSVQFKLLNE